MIKRNRNRNTNTFGSIGRDIYDGSAKLGSFMGWVSLASSILIFIVLEIIGLYMIFTYDKGHYPIVQGKVIDSSQCLSKKDCIVKIEYEYEGKEMTKKILSGSQLFEHDIVKLVVDPEYPQSAKLKPVLSSRGVGFLLVGIGLVVIIGSAIHFYITQKFKFAATASGVSTAWGMVT